MKPLCWCELGESVVIGPEVVKHNIEKMKVIQENMRASKSLQKSYHDKRRKAIEFQEGDHMFLRVTLVTGVGRALKSRNLTPHFKCLYQILQRIR